MFGYGEIGDNLLDGLMDELNAVRDELNAVHRQKSPKKSPVKRVDADKEASFGAFRDLVERMHGTDSDKNALVAVMERMLKSPMSIPGNALMLALPYSDYLKTEHWKKKREEVLREYGYRCSFCNANDTELHCHHRTYKNVGYEQKGDVICLCKKCHKVFHDNRTADMQR